MSFQRYYPPTWTTFSRLTQLQLQLRLEELQGFLLPSLLRQADTLRLETTMERRRKFTGVTMYVCICVCIYIYMHCVCICKNISYIYMCIYIYVYICIYIYDTMYIKGNGG